ncbi:MAG TPA: protein kinase [Ramlibacter sp.]|uniref:protein kinase domain-containing protein n=1 Tax=Ramlibacter sp. TaxID=1917967 RepID=UPI002BF6D7D5|nr:protein kinase [Ramlibacter sp.]HVZ42976.1 protein kinase [Ramlibacter sp.]
MSSPPSIPHTIGKYRVIRELGRGASSAVYLAEDAFNNRQVAVKRIHQHLLADERQARRLRRGLRNEALLAGRLRHPHIVRLYDADDDADPPYLVLEYLQGTSLARFCTPDRLLPVPQVLDIVYKCCSALEHAQEIGLVHRDIKPANLMLQSNGDVKLTDFGTALSVQGDVTQVAGLVGSPLYMAPEQVREEQCTHQSDMFSLTVVMYELLTGRRPFEGDSDYATLYKIGNEDPPMPSVLRPGLPPGLDAVISQGLAKKAQDRFATWSDFADAVLQLNKSNSAKRAQHRDGERFAQMRALPFFAGFHDAVLWEALRLGMLNIHSAGHELMTEDTPGDSFCVLLEGTVSISRRGQRLNSVEAGVTLGEMAYLQPEAPTRTATAIAESEVVVLEIKNEALRHASEDLQIRFDKAFIDLLVKRLMVTTEKLGKAQSEGLHLVDK